MTSPTEVKIRRLMRQLERTGRKLVALADSASISITVDYSVSIFQSVQQSRKVK